jgi:WD40 repeat protein
MHRLLPISLLLCALLLPAAAHADSIVYSKSGGVWAARPDGSGARKIASGYAHPTQANDGTILAMDGNRFVRLSRSGRVLAKFNSVMTGLPGGIDAVGPFDPVISPDGTKVAYWIGMYSTWHDGRNDIDWNHTGSVVIWQDARNGRILGTTHYYEDPSWFPDSTGGLLFDENNVLTAQVVAAAVGADHNHIKQWFDDYSTMPGDEEYPKGVTAGELSPQLDRLAMLRAGTHAGNGGLADGQGNMIATYAVKLPDPPVMECRLTGATGGTFGRPSWSPDGSSLTWQEGDGVWAMAIGHRCEGKPKLVIPGATEPDWGPAGVGGGGGGGEPTVSTPATISRGSTLRVRVSCAGACRVAAVARQGGRRVGRATRRGSGRLALRLHGVRRGRRLSVRVVVRPASGRAVIVKRSVRLRG